ncbi:MAG TPA: hypothetical protein VNV44_11745 [Solirubrobacteraceae bacterium]|nr:hypothetical protein [Solirubrobacteraceae bacterium]
MSQLLKVSLYAPQAELIEKVDPLGGVVCAAGRRGGKTRLAAAVALADLLFRPDLDAKMLPGEARYSVCVANSIDQSKRLLEAARLIVDGSPVARSMLESDTTDELRFTLPDGHRGILKCMPCASRSTRGWPVSTLCLDECAHFLSDTDGDRAAERIYQALRPAMAQFDGGRVLAISSPMGDSNWFAKRWRQADSGALTGWGAFKYTSRELNPTLSEAFLEEARLEEPETFPSEYLAQFEAGGTSLYIEPDRIRVNERLLEGEPGDADEWIAGSDPATSEDAWGLAMLGRRGERLVLGPYRAFQPDAAAKKQRVFHLLRKSQDRVIGEVADVCKQYNARVYTDQHLSQAVVAALREHGVHATTFGLTGERKLAAFKELRGALYSGRLVLPNNAMLLEELQRLRVKNTADGPRILLGRSKHGHSDALMALAVAAWHLRYVGVVKHGKVGAGKNTLVRGGALNAGGGF